MLLHPRHCDQPLPESLVTRGGGKNKHNVKPTKGVQQPMNGTTNPNISLMKKQKLKRWKIRTTSEALPRKPPRLHGATRPPRKKTIFAHNFCFFDGSIFMYCRITLTILLPFNKLLEIYKSVSFLKFDIKLLFPTN